MRINTIVHVKHLVYYLGMYQADNKEMLLIKTNSVLTLVKLNTIYNIN